MYKSSQNPPADKPSASKSKDTKPVRTKGQETKERILQMALEYFNRNGIEYVGIRELARELGLSPGNVSYYFPTKEDLVMAIAKRLSEENSVLFAQTEQQLSLTSFLDLFAKAFINHYKYRCLFVSFVHVMRNHKTLSDQYLLVQKQRRASLSHDLLELSKLGALKKGIEKEEINRLVATLSYQARFWIQEAEVLNKGIAIEKVMGHFLGLIAGILLPYATAKGHAQLQPYLASILPVTRSA